METSSTEQIKLKVYGMDNNGHDVLGPVDEWDLGWEAAANYFTEQALGKNTQSIKNETYHYSRGFEDGRKWEKNSQSAKQVQRGLRAEDCKTASETEDKV